MNDVVITGASGTVGGALTPRLGNDFVVVPVDRPEVDILEDSRRLRHRMRGSDAVVHLAFDPGGDRTPREHWQEPTRNAVNTALLEVVLEATLTEGVRLFLHASSIHVEDSMAWAQRVGAPLWRARAGMFATEPASGYGASKREQETRLQAVADRLAHGAVCLRLGGVTPDDTPLSNAYGWTPRRRQLASRLDSGVVSSDENGRSRR